jgi:hypothetical protein
VAAAGTAPGAGGGRWLPEGEPNPKVAFDILAPSAIGVAYGEFVAGLSIKARHSAESGRHTRGELQLRRFF